MSPARSRKGRGFARARLALAALGLILVAAWWIMRPDASSTAPAATPPALSATPPSPPASLSTPEETQATNAHPSPPPAAVPLPDGEAAQEAIHELSITYDVASIPALARFLDHPDPEIREAARDGLINLGERAAIPVLEAAARRAEGAESQALREAAEFLALPTWTERRAALKNTPPATP